MCVCVRERERERERELDLARHLDRPRPALELGECRDLNAVAVGRVVVVGRCWIAAHHRGLSAVSRARQGGVDVVLREEPVLVLQGCHLGGRGRGASGSVVGTSRTPLGRPRQLANSWKKRRARGLLSHPRRGNGAHLNRVGALAGPAAALEANHAVFARHDGPRIPTPGTLTPPTTRSAAACAPSSGRPHLSATRDLKV